MHGVVSPVFLLKWSVSVNPISSVYNMIPAVIIAAMSVLV